jgi:hypothetical protein
MHADQAVPEVKDDREAKHLGVELGTDIQVRNGQTDVVYSTERQGHAVSSCRRFVRRPGRRRHEGFLPLQRSPSRIGLDRSGAEPADRQCPNAGSPLASKAGSVCSRLLNLVPPAPPALKSRSPHPAPARQVLSGNT